MSDPLPGPTPECIAQQRAAAERMFPEIEGRPAVCVEAFEYSLWVFLSGQVSQLRMEVV